MNVTEVLVKSKIHNKKIKVPTTGHEGYLRDIICLIIQMMITGPQINLKKIKMAPEAGKISHRYEEKDNLSSLSLLLFLIFCNRYTSL